MATFQITSPDGAKYQVSAPDNATQDQVMSYVQQHHAATQAITNPPQQSPQQAAFAAGQAQGGQNGAVTTALDQAARQYLPLGLGNDVSAAARYVGQRAVGVPNPDSFATDLAYGGGISAGEQAAHPVAGTAGGIVGGVGQAVATTPLLKAAMPFKAALAVKTAAQGGTKLGNAARIVGQGAIAGATDTGATGVVQGGINGGNPSATGAAIGGLEGASEGAVVGGIAAPVATAGATLLAKGARAVMSTDSSKAIASLAKIFSMSPNDIAAARSQFKLDTGGTLDPQTGIVTGGRDPAMGELTDLFNRGELHAMVGKNPILGARVANAANESAATLPVRMTLQANRALGPGEDQGALIAARDAATTRAMGPIRNDQIPLTPEEVEFMRSDVVPNSGLTQLGRRQLHEDLDQGVLSLGNADTLRQSLNARASANPGEGFHELANGIRQIATDASPEYETIMEDHAANSRYINGHAHGITGKTMGQTSDQGLIADLATPEGQQGYQSGLATRYEQAASKSPSSAASLASDLANNPAENINLARTFSPLAQQQLSAAAGAENRGLESLQGIAPSMPKAQAGVNVPQLALATVSHSLPMKVFHVLKASLGNKMSDGVANVVADYLTQPGRLQQGINLMRAHGVSEAQTRDMLAKISVPSAALGSQLAQQGQ